MITIGEIVKAQGIKGELKINPLTNDVARFRKLKEVVVNGHTYKVVSSRVAPNGVFIMLEGVTDRNTAETMIGKNLEVSRDNAVKLKKGEYFIVDIIGSDVTCDGQHIGTLTEVLQNGSADVYVVKADNGKEIMFPALKAVLRNVDVDNKVIDLDGKKFGEIAVYED